MARFRALVKCFVDNSLREEGDVFEYNGPANPNLEPLDAPAEDAGAKGGRGKRGGPDPVGGEA